MRKYTLMLGGVLAVGGVVGAIVHGQEATPIAQPPALFAPPQTFAAPDAARPIDESVEDAAPQDTDMSVAPPDVTVDHYVRPSAATTPQVASRRSGGLAGRLQAIRRSEQPEGTAEQATDETTAATPIAAKPVANTRTLPRSSPAPLNADEETTDETDSASTNAMPSVLKKSAGTPVVKSPSDQALPSASTVRPSQRSGAVRSAPAKESFVSPPATNPATSSSSGGATSGAKKPSQRMLTLASGANASLSVETNGPKAMTLGKPAIYTVTVNNLGVGDANDVFVAVNLPAHVELGEVKGTVGDAQPANEGKGQRLVWQIDRVAGRGMEKLTLELTPKVGEPVDLNVEWTMAPPMISSQVEVQEPKLTMVLKGPKDVQYGETAVYQIVVANPGTGDAEDVVVNLLSADASDADAKKLGTIAAGQQKIIEVSMTASQAGVMKMHFAAKSGTLLAEATEEVQVRRANIQLAMQGPQLVFAGSEATYQVQITNAGDAPAENVQLGVLLPEGAEYLGGIKGAKAKGGQLVWTGGALAAGATTQYEFTCQMKTAGTSDVQLQAHAGDLVADASATTKVEAVADLKLVVADPLGPKPVGEEVVYQVTITNRGTKAARKVAVVVNFSEGVEPTGVEGAKAEVGGGQALFQPISSIEPGAELVLKIKAKAEKAGSHIFRAEVRCTDPETRLASEQTSRFFGGGSSVVSSQETDNAPQLAPSGVGAKPMKTKLR